MMAKVCGSGLIKLLTILILFIELLCSYNDEDIYTFDTSNT